MEQTATDLRESTRKQLMQALYQIQFPDSFDLLLSAVEIVTRIVMASNPRISPNIRPGLYDIDAGGVADVVMRLYEHREL